MTRINAHNLPVPVSLRTSVRRVTPVNAPSEYYSERRDDVPAASAELHRRAISDRRYGDHAPIPAQIFSTNSRMLVGLQNVGEQERVRSRPAAYEAAARYEDRYFESVEPGLFERKYA